MRCLFSVLYISTLLFFSEGFAGVQFSGIYSRIDFEKEVGKVEYSSQETEVIRWNTVLLKPVDAHLVVDASHVLQKAGLVEEKSISLFDVQDTDADYVLAASLVDISLKKKMPKNAVSGTPELKGQEASVVLEWELYSTREAKVVSKLKTAGHSQDIENAAGKAIGEAAKALIQESSFFQASKRKLAFASCARTKTFDQIKNAIVTVQTEDGHGSGFFISKEGFLLTNHHVIKGAKKIAVKLLDGTVAKAKVIRFDEKRDIAYLKAEITPSQILCLNTNRPQVGEEVLAIGSPLEEEFESTVTKGIVSAYRTNKGYPLLQSDTSIWEGSSGGPLVDKQGRVVAVAVETMQINEVPTNMNFFIPIDSALEVLGLDG